MGDRLIGVIEELTGRKVLTYQSQVLFQPNIVIEIFVFDEDGAAGPATTSAGQLGDAEVGAATDDDLSSDDPAP